MANGTCMLFINKSASSKSLSRSKGAERARIFSHVQKNPLENPLRAGCQYEEPTFKVWSLTSRPKAPAKKSRSCKERSPPKPRSNTTSRRSSRSHSPLSPLGLVEYDPFESTAVPIVPGMNPLLQFYGGALLDRVFVNKALADVSRKYTLAYATEDPVALYAILCTASAALYSNSLREKDRLSTLHFKCQAIHHLQQQLDGSPGSSGRISTAYAVALLLWVECLQCDVEAVEAHTRGLAFLLSRVHGIEDCPFPILTHILSCHYHASSMIQVRPTIDTSAISATSSLRSSPQPPCNPLMVPPDGFCSAFFAPTNFDLIGSHIAQIILNGTRCLRFKVRWSEESSQPSSEDLERSYSLQGPIGLALIDLPYQSGVTLTPVQDAVRLAFWSLTRSITRIAPTSSSFRRSMARQLTAAINKCSLVKLWQTKESAELLLWIVFVGLYNSRGQQEWSTLITYASMTVERLDVETETQVEDILSRYVYSARFCRDTLESAWRDVRLTLGASIVTI